MRICLYTDTALPKMGGQEMVVDALAKEFLAIGHQPVVLAPLPRYPLRPRDSRLPYPVIRHPRFYSTRFFVDWYRWFLLKLHKKFPFEILHCHGVYPPGYLTALTRDRLQVPTLITSHGGDVREGAIRHRRQMVYDKHKQALQGVDVLVAISRFTREGFLRMGADPAKIIPIANGVDLQPFADSISRPEELDAKIQPGKYALFLGRLKHRKGVDLLLDGFTQVPDTGEVQLVVAGDGEEYPVLLEKSKRFNLDHRVRFVGATFGKSKGYLLQNALCTVMPSRTWEAFPLVLLESFAAGTPVIGAKVPGLEDLIEPNENGWFVSPENSSELGEVLTKIFTGKLDPTFQGNKAKEIAKNYSWRAIAQQHLDLYRRLLQGAGRKTA